MGSITVLFILALFTAIFSTGAYLIFADMLSLPDNIEMRVILQISKAEKKKKMNFDVCVFELSLLLSKFIRLDEYKKIKIASSLKSAELSITPETYIAKAWVKSGLVLLLIIPALLIFPLISFIILFLSIMVYFKEIRFAEELLRKKRDAIENELPGFVMTLDQELKDSRDVLGILETYMRNTGVDFRNELEITTADMKSGSYEAALSRFEARIGSSMLSDVVRGLLSVLRGDDGRVYFQMLAHDFKLQEIQKLKIMARKQPAKLRKYSFFILGCFMLMYLVVMSIDIMEAFRTLF